MPTKRDNEDEHFARIDKMLQDERDLRERGEKARRAAADALEHAKTLTVSAERPPHPRKP